MKVLFLDFACFRGHQNLNISLLNILKEICSFIEVIAIENYYPNEIKPKNSNINFIEYKKCNIRFSNKLFVRIDICIRMLKCFLIIRKLEYDKIIIVGYENISFSILGRLFYKKNSVYLIHHQNLDELTNKIKLWLFKKSMNKVKHIVFGNFINEYLTNIIGVNKKNVYIIPHPMKNNENKGNNINKNEKLIIAISNSNDESLIKKVINDYENGIFKINGNIKLILRSQNIAYNNKGLIVINHYLDINEYNKYFDKAYAIALLFPRTFKYRMSGTLIDAIANNKIVFGTDIYCIREYSKKYPLLFKIINDINDIIEFLNYDLYTDNVIEQIKQFTFDHSDNEIKKAFKQILK